MPRYYCDYCDTYLTHDSPSVRKQHGQGYKHKANVRIYYQQFEEQQTQILIDQRIKEHLGKTAVYQPLGATFNQHLVAIQGRPQMSLLPTPGMPNAGNPMNLPMFRGIMPPVLPRPGLGGPGGMPVPNMPQMVGPPGAPFLSQTNGLQLPGPPTVGAPPTMPTSSAPPMAPPAMYQLNSPAQTSSSYDQN